MTNQERAERASELMLMYSDMIGDHPDMETLIGDFLADCCHALGEDSVENAFHRGIRHYRDEKAGLE